MVAQAYQLGSMAANRIQFQKGLSQPQFMELYGTEEKCEAALEKARWPEGSAAPAVVAMTAAWCMAGGTSAICAGVAVIRPPLPPAPSWRRPSCR